MKNLINMLKGMAIGISNIIPGVSGGTMAVVLGIYDKIISSVINFFKDWKKNGLFLAELAIGAAIGILAFSNLITFLLDNYPSQTNLFFIGLILGSAPLIFKKATESQVNKSNYVWFVIAFVLLAIMGIVGEAEGAIKVVSELSIGTIIILLIAGFVAAATMILPGVSGSFILIMIGMYYPIVNAVKEFNIPVLIVVAVGVLLGFITMTKVIETLFNKYPQTVYFIILGLILGSIFGIYSGIGNGFMILVSISDFIIGFLISYMLGKKE
ncbi:DUF368 domain-containing protein [Clostridium septicum]|uniref:DUF368 domain-containing protein n=2 Tax=Clostridium septicum TaxID=1504 RepID=A0A9N7PLK7_CLOSE|nr:DUF368 domain-containing protein [Clostridium septicum]AYE35562.1 DUF368 domain-containing protein [Clostridium septicum]QAS60949.1 DUF368 domain-containing protein [Clostridium septicum]UEC19775.1 DUF368 domain-containing protein [Clostridium septicum]USS02166.1 DUF368 domain-containing protein [Clostridium septicum]WLF70741.1 DUF368 domain-containing protein [Clostridium septicum]